MQFVDTHTHLDIIAQWILDTNPVDQDDEYRFACSLAFSDAVAGIMERARQSGIVSLLQISVNYTSNIIALELVKSYIEMQCALGIHPHEAAKYTDSQLNQIKKWTNTPDVAAIGEIGLDYYRDQAPRDKQKELFEKELALAAETVLPVIIHNREADQDVYDFLARYRDLPGIVMHCYGSNKEWAKRFLDLGAYISFAGNVTFKKAADLQDAAQYVPADRLLAETDAPFLAPVPKRGKTNEPSYVAHTYAFLAELRGDDLEKLSNSILQNCRRLFGVPKDE